MDRRGFSVRAARRSPRRSSPPAIRRGPTAPRGCSHFAERKNESVERALFRHTSMDRVSTRARAPRGAPFPSTSSPTRCRCGTRRRGGRGARGGRAGGDAPSRLSLDDLMTPAAHHAAREPLLRGRVDRGGRLDRRPAASELATLAGMHADAQYVDFAVVRRRLPRELGPRAARCTRRRSSPTAWTAGSWVPATAPPRASTHP